MQKMKLGRGTQKIVDFFSNKRKTLALISGLLLAMALPPFYQFWTVPVAFSVAMWLCMQTQSARRLAGIGYWFGFGYFAAGFYWIGNALLIDIATTGILYPLVLFLNGAVFGLFTILPFMITRRGRNLAAKMVLFAAMWFFCTEWLRSFIFTGFPWNPISSVLAFRPALLQTLAWWGTYGLSMVVILTAFLPVMWLLNPTKKRLAWVAASFGIFGVLWEYGAYILGHIDQNTDGDEIMVRLVQPAIPQSLKWSRTAAEDNFKSYIDLSTEKDNHHIDFTFWGETASPFDLTHDESHRTKLWRAVPKHGYLITGLLRYDITPNGYVPYNSLAVINRRTQILNLYDKAHLVPFGEYIPFREYLPDWVHPLTNTIAEFGHGQQFKTITLDGYPEFSPLICYEVIFSDDVVRKGDKPLWAVVLTNDGWYGMSAGPYQHLVAAQMRAVEEGMTVVRSANSGISAVITPYGEVPAKIALGERGVEDVAVKLSLAHRTLFGEYGNAIPIMMAFGLMFIAWLINKGHQLKLKMYLNKKIAKNTSETKPTRKNKTALKPIRKSRKTRKKSPVRRKSEKK
jgi:apolipoprotein N-acyltransferase